MRVWLAVCALFAALFAGVAGAVMAHEEATGIVKERMDAMRTIKNHRKTIDDMLAGKKYLSHKRLLRSLNIIKSHSGAEMTKLFPEGSHGRPSEADPKIWQDWSGFETQAQRFAGTVDRFLSDANAKASTQQLQQNLKNLRASCNSCHDAYRE